MSAKDFEPPPDKADDPQERRIYDGFADTVKIYVGLAFPMLSSPSTGLFFGRR
jgi:hypothetical protein